MQIYPCGHDFGNAETCVTMFVRGKKVSKCVPSVVALGSMSDLESFGLKTGPKGFVFRDYNSEIELYIGQLAVDQSSMTFDSKGDISRYESDKSRIMLLAVSSSLVEDAEYGLNVVTGLPIETYKGDPNGRKNIKSSLEGTYTFYINGRLRTAHITVSRVIMEGAGAAIGYSSNEDIKQGVIDIGGRTTDLYVSQGLTPLIAESAGKALGVHLAGDLLSKNFEKKYGWKLNASQLRQCLFASVGTGKYPRLSNDGDLIQDIPALTTSALKQIGDEIVSFVSATWRASEGNKKVASGFNSVLLVGGGAYYFYESLKDKIPHLVFIDSPEEANSYGYAVFALGQMQAQAA